MKKIGAFLIILGTVLFIIAIIIHKSYLPWIKYMGLAFSICIFSIIVAACVATKNKSVAMACSYSALFMCAAIGIFIAIITVCEMSHLRSIAYLAMTGFGSFLIGHEGNE